MSPSTIPDLTDKATGDAIDAALARAGTGTPATDAARRRLRERLSPQANGDQDTW